MTLDELLELAETATTEDERLDFKCEFRPEKKAAFWAELVKDLVAFANSNGGVIVFGINDDGSKSADDCAVLLTFDPAKITDQINKYTGTQFSQFRIDRVVRNGSICPVTLIEPTRIPLVFFRVGTYETEDGSQKNAFSRGAVYFRHGAKSEPATQDDLRASFDRELRRVREEWLGNMRQVVEAPPGSTVTIAGPIKPISELRLSSDPSAPAITVRRLSDTHPYRQSEVIAEVKRRVQSLTRFNSHDIQAIKSAEGIDHDSRPDMVHKPHEVATPQYSEAFVDMVCARIKHDQNFLAKCRLYIRDIRYGGVIERMS